MAEYNEENTRGGKTGVAVRKAVTSDAYRGISKALTGSAYRSFGKAFDGGGYTPRGMRPDTSYLDNWEEAGRNAQAALEDRWYKNEFANFRKNHLNQYQAEMEDLGYKMSSVLDELAEGRWEESDGEVTILDYNNPIDRAKGNRLKGMVESQVSSRMSELQINLNNTAAEKYGTNPIIDGLIQKMMESQTQAMSAQFQQPATSKQADAEMKLRTGEADIAYKESLTRQAEASTERMGQKYNSTDSVVRDMGHAQAARYFANNVEGKQLLQGTDFPNYVTQMEQAAAKEFTHSQKWNPQEAMTQPNKEATQAYINSKRPGIQQRAYYEWVKNEYGEDAAEEAARDRPGMKELPEAPFKYDVEVNPSKKETKTLTDKWDALGVAIGNEALAKDPDMSKKEVKDWLMDEWLPEALSGRDIAHGGAYNEQFDGMTADEKNKAAAPYLKAVRDSLKKALKWIGSGEGTEGLLPEQKRTQRGPGRRGGLSRTLGGFIDTVTPGSKGLYPPDFRKQFPQDEDTEE